MHTNNLDNISGVDYLRATLITFFHMYVKNCWNICDGNVLWYTHVFTVYMHTNNLGNSSSIHYLAAIFLSFFTDLCKLLLKYVIETSNFTQMCMYILCIYTKKIWEIFQVFIIWEIHLFSFVPCLSVTVEILVIECSNVTHICINLLCICTQIIWAILQVFFIWQLYCSFCATCMSVGADIFVI